MRRAGLILAAMYVGFFGLFVAGDAFADPGGWTALGLVAAWLLPTVLLSLLADDTGPVRGVVTMALSAPLAVLDAPLLLIAALLLISARLDHQTHGGTAPRARGPSTGPPHPAR